MRRSGRKFSTGGGEVGAENNNLPSPGQTGGSIDQARKQGSGPEAGADVRRRESGRRNPPTEKAMVLEGNHWSQSRRAT